MIYEDTLNSEQRVSKGNFMVVLQLVLHGPKNHEQWNNFPRIHPRFGYMYEFQSADKTCVERLVRGNRAFSFVHR